MDQNRDERNRNVVQKAVVYDQMSQSKKDMLAIASFVSGLCALIFCMTVVLSLICGIYGLIAASICLTQKRKNSGYAIAGMILSILGIFATVIMIALIVIGIIF